MCNLNGHCPHVLYLQGETVFFWVCPKCRSVDSKLQSDRHYIQKRLYIYWSEIDDARLKDLWISPYLLSFCEESSKLPVKSIPQGKISVAQVITPRDLTCVPVAAT